MWSLLGRAHVVRDQLVVEVWHGEDEADEHEDRRGPVEPLDLCKGAGVKVTSLW